VSLMWRWFEINLQSDFQDERQADLKFLIRILKEGVSFFKALLDCIDEMTDTLNT